MISIKTYLANRKNYGVLIGTPTSDWYIILHYTANDGDTDEANAIYFANNIVYASAQYFADDDSITNSVPVNYQAYAVGGAKWKNTAGASLYKIATNKNSINIEMCDTVKDGVVMVSETTRKNTIELVAYLMKEYSIPLSHVIRHYDVTGKPCPAYYVDETAWAQFKTDVHTYYVTGSHTVANVVDIVTSVYPATPFSVNVKVSKLRLRQSANGTILGYISKGTHTVTEVSGNWGKVDGGWIYISNPDYVTIGETVTVNQAVIDWKHAWNVGFDYIKSNGTVLKSGALTENDEFGSTERAFAKKHYLYRGIKGCPTAVKWLQTQLGVKVDGDFGGKTSDALYSYQSSHGLTADRKCGPATIACLLGV